MKRNQEEITVATIHGTLGPDFQFGNKVLGVVLRRLWQA